MTSTKTLHDVYLPVKLFNKKVVILLDTGCDTSILGACLVPKGIYVEPPSSHLLAANGTKIPLIRELKMNVKIAGREHVVSVAVTEVVGEFIPGIDFLSEQRCPRDFGSGCILLRDDRVPLQRCSTFDEHCHVYVCLRLPSTSRHAGGSTSIRHLVEFTSRPRSIDDRVD